MPSFVKIIIVFVVIVVYFAFLSLCARLMERERKKYFARAGFGVVVSRRSKKDIINGNILYIIDVDCEVFACGVWQTVRKTFTVPYEFYNFLHEGDEIPLLANQPVFERKEGN